MGVGGTPDHPFGRPPQRNLTARSAADFFRTARLRPLLDCAEPQFSARDQGRFGTLGDQLPRLIPLSPPALVHGDLWRGNVRYTGRSPALIDPAATFSHREVHLAALNLFARVLRMAL
ncbi:fructosamine kinase family protein [Deinococcus taeanensis]|nr:fructosamine kinase family protein [Deinococcus taeanensis]